MTDTLSPEEKQALKATQIVFIVIAVSILIVLLGAIVFTQLRGALMPEMASYKNGLIIGAAAFSFICSLWAKRQFTKAVETAKTSLKPLTDKVTMYRSSLIIYLAISELPILFCVILSIMTGSFVFQVYAAVLLGFLLSAMPSRERVMRQLEG